MKGMTTVRTTMIMFFLVLMSLCTVRSMESASSAFLMRNGKLYRDKSTMEASRAVASFATQYQHSLNEQVLKARAAAQLSGSNGLQEPRFFSATLDQPIGTLPKLSSMYYKLSRGIKVPEKIKMARMDADMVEEQLLQERQRQDFSRDNNLDKVEVPVASSESSKLVVTTFPAPVSSPLTMINRATKLTVTPGLTLENYRLSNTNYALPSGHVATALYTPLAVSPLSSNLYSSQLVRNAHLLGQTERAASFSYSTITGRR